MEEAAFLEESNSVVTRKGRELFQRELEAAENCTVFDSNRFLISVDETLAVDSKCQTRKLGRFNVTVSAGNGSEESFSLKCNCNIKEQLGMPCRHLLATTQMKSQLTTIGKDQFLLQNLCPIWHTENYSNCYPASKEIVLPTEQLEAKQKILGPILPRVGPGRPRLTRWKSASEGGKKRKIQQKGMDLLRAEAQAEFVYRKVYNFSVLEDDIVNSSDELSDSDVLIDLEEEDDDDEKDGDEEREEQEQEQEEEQEQEQEEQEQEQEQEQEEQQEVEQEKETKRAKRECCNVSGCRKYTRLLVCDDCKHCFCKKHELLHGCYDDSDEDTEQLGLTTSSSSSFPASSSAFSSCSA